MNSFDTVLRRLFIQFYNYMEQPFMSSPKHQMRSIEIYKLITNYIYEQKEKRVIYTVNLVRALDGYREVYSFYIEELLKQYSDRPHPGSSYEIRSFERRQLLERDYAQKIKYIDYVKQYLYDLEFAYRKQSLKNKLDPKLVARHILSSSQEWLILLLEIFIDTTYDSKLESEWALYYLSRNIPLPTDPHILVDKGNSESNRSYAEFQLPENHWSKKKDLNFLPSYYEYSGDTPAKRHRHGQ